MPTTPKLTRPIEDALITTASPNGEVVTSMLVPATIVRVSVALSATTSGDALPVAVALIPLNECADPEPVAVISIAVKFCALKILLANLIVF